MEMTKKRPGRQLIFALFILAAGVIASFLVPGSAAQSSSANAARGKYLVENVARCGDCHSPRDDKGAPIRWQTVARGPADV